MPLTPVPLTRRRVLAPAVLTAVVTAAGIVATTAPATAAPTAATSASFYTPPSTLPAANGAIVRSAPLPLVVPLPAKATLLMYRSTDTAGKPVAVTGTYLEPTKAWAGGGARPLVTYAVGTQGQGDDCAPSKGFASGVTTGNGGFGLNYEIPFVANLLDKGVAVVVTDYVGLGTTDRLHTYVNRLDQAHAVLDAARAAKRLSGTSLTAASKVAAYGYSQGGGAAAAAAELARSYAPDVPLVGTFAGAPPADLTATLKQIDGTALVAAVGWALNGFVQTYPQLKPILDREASPVGKAVLADLARRCTPDGLLTYAFRSTSQWTTSGQTVAQIISRYPAIQAVLRAQLIGTLEPAAPVLVTTGTLDDFVPHAQVKTVVGSWCAKGATVEYRPVKQYIPSLGTGANHLGPLATEVGYAQQWVLDRLAGKPATSNCPAVPTLP